MVKCARCHSVIYCAAPAEIQVLSQVQVTFSIVQQSLFDLKHIVHAEKNNV